MDDSMEFQTGLEDDETWMMDLDKISDLDITCSQQSQEGPGLTRHDRHQKEIDKVKDKIDNLQGDNDKAGPSGANKGPRGKGAEKKPLPQRGTGNVRQLAPGIKVFTEPAWQYFTHRELDLVRDFNYSLRNEERKFKSKENFLAMINDPMKFLSFLSPENTSNAFLDNNDLLNVAEYLLFTLIGFCPALPENENNNHSREFSQRKGVSQGWRYQLYRKCLFKLLHTYNIKGWKILPVHLIIGLVNLGGNHDLLANQELFDELFKPVIERDKKRQMAQRKKSKDPEKRIKDFRLSSLWPPFFARIYEERKKDPTAYSTPTAEQCIKHLTGRDGVPEEVPLPQLFTGEEIESASDATVMKHVQMDAVGKLISLFVDLIITFETPKLKLPNGKITSKIMPRPCNKDGWPDKNAINCMVFHYLIAVTAMDTCAKLIPDVTSSAQTQFRLFYDSFSEKQFWGESVDKEDKEATTPCTASSVIYDTKHMLFTLSKFVRNYEEAWVYKSDSERVTPGAGVLSFGMDHHHNLVEWVRTVSPGTFRGRHLGRCLAQMWIKQILHYKQGSSPTKQVPSQAQDPTSLMKHRIKLMKQNPDNYIRLDTSPSVDLAVLANLLEEKKNKLSVLCRNAYLYVSLVLLIDQVVGAEPILDKPDPDKADRMRDHVERIKIVLDNVRTEMEADKVYKEEFQKWKDFYNQFPKKWDLLVQTPIPKKPKQTYMSQYFNSLGRSSSRFDLESSQASQDSQA